MVIDGETVPGTVRHLGLEPVATDAEPPRYALDVVFEPPRILRRGRSIGLDLP